MPLCFGEQCTLWGLLRCKCLQPVPVRRLPGGQGLERCLAWLASRHRLLPFPPPPAATTSHSLLSLPPHLLFYHPHPTNPPPQGNANRFPDAATCEAAAAQYCQGRSDRLALQLMSAGPADATLAAGAAGSGLPTEAPAAGTEVAAPAKSGASTGRSLFAWAALAAMFHLL